MQTGLKSLFLLVVLIACAQLWAAEAPSSEQLTNREVVATFVRYYLLHQEYSDAIRTLSDHVATDAKDGGAWHLLGMAYLGSGENGRASKAFYEAMKNSTGEVRSVSLYAYADALNRSGDSEKARATLVEATGDSLIAESATLALLELKPRVALAPLQLSKSSVWHASVGLAAGYDSNVLLSSDAVMATITRSDTASPVLSVTGQFSNEKSLKNGSLETRIAGGINGYSAAISQKYNTIFSSLGLDWVRNPEEGKVFYRIGNGFDINWLNSSGYKFFSWSDTLRPRVIFRHSQGVESEVEVPVYYQRFSFDSAELAENNRSGPGVRVGFNHRRAIGSGVFAPGLRFEKHFASGANYRANTYALPIDWSQDLFWGIGAGLGLEAAQVSYVAASPSRTDRSVRGSVALGRQFFQRVTGGLDYGVMRNSSTLPEARYTKHTIMLRMSYEF